MPTDNASKEPADMTMTTNPAHEELRYLQRAAERNAEDARKEIEGKLSFLAREINEALARLKARPDIVPSLGFTQTLADATAEAARMRCYLETARGLTNIMALMSQPKAGERGAL